MKTNTAFLAAVAVGLVSVTASPLYIPKRAVDPQHLPLIKCVQQKYPSFLAEGKLTPQELCSCIDNTKPNAKRTIEGNNAAADDAGAELIYEPEAKEAVQP